MNTARERATLALRARYYTPAWTTPKAVLAGTPEALLPRKHSSITTGLATRGDHTTTAGTNSSTTRRTPRKRPPNRPKSSVSATRRPCPSNLSTDAPSDVRRYGGLRRGRCCDRETARRESETPATRGINTPFETTNSSYTRGRARTTPARSQVGGDEGARTQAPARGEGLLPDRAADQEAAAGVRLRVLDRRRVVTVHLQAR